mmetsp:Transcript_45947/g.127523  ORF Transcript_45947/g.127523 Transcript_45947/m.127523 type:complete len:201 (-) Transcript_45947:134-736(-)
MPALPNAGVREQWDLAPWGRKCPVVFSVPFDGNLSQDFVKGNKVDGDWTSADDPTHIHRLLGGLKNDRTQDNPRGLLWYPNRRAKRWHPDEQQAKKTGDTRFAKNSCDGEAARCPWDNKREDTNMCWRVSYKNQMRAFNAEKGIFLQCVQEGKLGGGQKEEARWAEEIGMECWNISCTSSTLKSAKPGLYSEPDGPCCVM